MDVYSQREQRAHGTGFVGIEAETDDKIDNLEVYEALINPRESERGGGGQGGPGMMPPMMGMGGAGAGGAGAGGAGAAGLSTGMAGQAATGAAARIGVMGGPGAAPTSSGPAAASAGVGGPSLGGLGAGGGGGMPSMPGGPAAAGLPADPAEETLSAAPVADPAADDVPVEPGGGIGEIVAPEAKAPDTLGPPPDVISVDPAAVEQTAREWSSLASEMADISKTASQLQATHEDFGLVRQPAGPYSEVSDGIRELAGSASKEFDQIATGLNFGAQAYRDHEAQAAQSVRSAQ